MQAVLVHGMARTPLAMLILAARLRRGGITCHLFAYSAAFERWRNCCQRLQRFIQRRIGQEPYLLIGHSLGSVLIRGAFPHLPYKPSACFFLAPPTSACWAARYFAPRALYQWATGEMGQLLANPAFMASLAVPEVPTRIYAGINGPRGRYSPFGGARNDGILAEQETDLPGATRLDVAAVHTFIMNSSAVAADILRVSRALHLA